MTKIAEGVFVQDTLPTPPNTFTLNSAASTNATLVRTGAGNVFSISASNANAAPRYLKIYDKATAPVVGTDRPVLTVPVPANGLAHLPFPQGLRFTNGIALALTTGVADTDVAAVAVNELKVAIGYF